MKTYWVIQSETDGSWLDEEKFKDEYTAKFKLEDYESIYDSSFRLIKRTEEVING